MARSWTAGGCGSTSASPSALTPPLPACTSENRTSHPATGTEAEGRQARTEDTAGPHRPTTGAAGDPLLHTRAGGPLLHTTAIAATRWVRTLVQFMQNAHAVMM